MSCDTSFFFFFNDPATTEIYTLSLHDALPISKPHGAAVMVAARRLGGISLIGRGGRAVVLERVRSEEHTSELQSPDHLVCRLLLEKKKKKQLFNIHSLNKCVKVLHC